jgi:hypothetical protein
VKVTCKSGSLPDFSAVEERRSLRDLQRRLRRANAEGVVEDEEESISADDSVMNGHVVDDASTGKPHADGVTEAGDQSADDASRDGAWRLERMQSRTPAHDDGRSAHDDGRSAPGDGR